VGGGGGLIKRPNFGFERNKELNLITETVTWKLGRNSETKEWKGPDFEVKTNQEIRTHAHQGLRRKDPFGNPG
jgi:hypothetical protein